MAIAAFASQASATSFTAEMPAEFSGKVIKWLKKPGDFVKEDEGLCEIETESMSFTFDSPAAGYLAKIIVGETGEAKPHDKLATLVTSADQLAAFENKELPSDKVSPSARALILNLGVNVSTVKATGKGGRITKEDVLVALGKAQPPKPASIEGSRVALPPSNVVYSVVPDAPKVAAAKPAPAPAPPQQQQASPAKQPLIVASPPAPVAVSAAAFDEIASPASLPRPSPGAYSDKKPSMVRKVISQRLTESKAGVPHFYATMDCRIDDLLELRKNLKTAGVNVSVNDIIVKAVAKALKVVPEVNCSWNPAKDDIDVHSSIDVSVAVATDGGLITPIVKNVDAKGLIDINDAVKDLAARARAGKLKPEEYQGGSFTISNLGMFGVDEFTAVINPPQSCILAVGGGISRAVLPEEYGGKVAPDAADTPVVATIMTVQMSADRRVVDEALAGQFLAVFRQFIQSPNLLVA